MYDDIEELPVERFNKANKYWMLSDHLGNSFEDIDKVHISKLYYVADNKDKVIKEIGNLRVLVHNILGETHPNQLAFASLVHSVDGVEAKDLTDDGLKRLVKELSDKGLSIGEVKKKSQGRGFKATWRSIFRRGSVMARGLRFGLRSKSVH